MNKKTYIVFRENNSFEEESWRRVFPYKGNEEVFNILKDINNINDCYECYLQDYTDDKIKSIIHDNRFGCFEFNNYMDGIFNIETVKNYMSSLEKYEYDPFYKLEWLFKSEIWR